MPSEKTEVRDLGLELEGHIKALEEVDEVLRTADEAARLDFYRHLQAFLNSVVAEVQMAQLAAVGGRNLVIALLNRLRVTQVVLSEPELQRAKRDLETNPFEVHEVGKPGEPGRALVLIRMGFEAGQEGRAN